MVFEPLPYSQSPNPKIWLRLWNSPGYTRFSIFAYSKSYFFSVKSDIKGICKGENVLWLIDTPAPFYCNFHAIWTSRYNFLLLYCGISYMIWATLLCKHMSGWFQVIWIILVCMTERHFIYQPTWASCSEIPIWTCSWPWSAACHKILATLFSLSWSLKKYVFAFPNISPGNYWQYIQF